MHEKRLMHGGKQTRVHSHLYENIQINARLFIRIIYSVTVIKTHENPKCLRQKLTMT